MEHRTAQGEPLLPAAGELSREPAKIRLQAVQFHNFVHSPSQPVRFEAVDAPIKLEVLRDRQIVVQAEILRHVTDPLANSLRLGADVEPLHLRFACAERQQAGQHLDHRGLAASVGPEETEDFSRFHAEAHAIDGREVAEASHEAFRHDRGTIAVIAAYRHFSFSRLAA